ENIEEMEEIVINDLLNQVHNKKVTVFNKTKNNSYETELTISPRQVEMLIYGGLLNKIREE
ncbi:MAG TPA: hypothetical protein DCG38_10305, partial [Eubacteriaceae bacterium]|nr:hypothetical protein [Eubacteriaceae bacterium]